jgi:Na+-driven multidrug efflux pump
MAILSVAIAWVALAVIAGSIAGLTLSQTFQGFGEATRSMAGDLVVAGAACLVPAVIGAAITQGEKHTVIIKRIGLGKE